MKALNRTLLLLAGIAANILIACGGEGAKDEKPPYVQTDTTRQPEYRNDSNSVSTGAENGNNPQQKQDL